MHHYQKNSGKKIDLDEKTLWTLQEGRLYITKIFLISEKRKNNNKGPENVFLQCEGGSWLDLQYKYYE